MPYQTHKEENRCYGTKELARRQFVSRPEARRRGAILRERDIGTLDARGRMCFSADELDSADEIFGLKKVKRTSS